MWLTFRPVGTDNAPSWLPLRIDGSVLRDGLVVGLIFGIGAAAVIAPVTARNLKEGDEFVLITAHGGINFYIGNNAEADGWYKTPPGLEGSQEGLIRSGRKKAEQETGRSMTHGEVSGWWFGEAKEFIFENPADAIALYLRKAGLFWHDYEKPLEGNFYYMDAHSSILRLMTLGFGLAAPFALLGLLLLLREWRTGSGLVLLFSLAYMGTLVLFFVTSRYRIVALPFLLLLASHAVWWGIGCVKRRFWKRLGLATLVLAAGFFLSNTSLLCPDRCRDCDLAFFHYAAGNVLSENDDHEASLEHYSEAIRLDPGVPYFHFNQGVAYDELGRREEAVQAFRIFCRRWPGKKPGAHFRLACNLEALAREGEETDSELLREAELHYKETLEINPRNKKAREGLRRIRERR